MPTGYTAGVADGTMTDFRAFALQCGRAFGATIMQRDDPMNEPPKHREPSDYYEKSLAEARARLTELEEYTAEDVAREAEAYYVSALASFQRYVSEHTAENERYRAMLREVDAWEPPTPDHAEMKRFMREQLTTSMSDYMPSRPKRRAPSVWIAEELMHARENVTRYEKNQADEIDRCAKANAWIDALYASLNAPVPV